MTSGLRASEPNHPLTGIRRMGIVNSAVTGATPTVNVTVGGDAANPVDLPYLPSYTPSVNDQVVILEVDGDRVVLGAVKTDGAGDRHVKMSAQNPNTTTPGSGTATWVTMGTIFIPIWATRGRTNLTMNSVTASAALAAINAAVKIGAVVNAAKRLTAPVLGRCPTFAINDLLAGLASGTTVTVTVEATFVQGTFTAPSSACDFDLNIDWLA
jgi:hypothetical protein